MIVRISTNCACTNDCVVPEKIEKLYLIANTNYLITFKNINWLLGILKIASP